MSYTQSQIDQLKNDINSDISKRFSALVPTPPPTPPPTDNALLNSTFDESYPFPVGTKSKDGNYFCKYVGSGKVAFENGVLRMVPKAATNYSNDSSGVGYETYACQVQTVNWFKNVQLDLDIKLNKQLRTGYSKYGANQQGPQPWETWWIFFRFTDEPPKSNHHYYFYIASNKWQFGKKDNKPNDNTVEQQIYIKSGTSPLLKAGVKQHVTITMKDFHFGIWVDGVKLVDMTDPTVNDPSKMSQGLIAIYCEDADIESDNIKVVGI